MSLTFELEEKLKSLKERLDPFKNLLENMEKDIDRPFNAIRDGYYETALTNVGSIIENLLKDVWRKEKISGIPIKKTIEQLTSVIKKKIEVDRLVDDYIGDIQKVRNRAAHGEKVLIDDCIEALRKLPTVLEWYSLKYTKVNCPVETFLCPKCGHRVQEGWKNCAFCGTKLEKDDLKCFFCGKEMEEGWNICPHCGKSFKTKVETVQESSNWTSSFLMGKKLGKYEVKNIIGRGAMGIIFKVWDDIEEEFKAVKMVPHAIVFDNLSFNNLKKEVKAASRISHPNVVKVMSLEAYEGIHFIVMEYIDGETLAQKLVESKDNRLNEKDVINYMIQAAEGLREAHKRGVIHLDLKPQNIMVTKDEEIKILDFSISFQITKSMTTLTGQYFSTGTLPYMAPEQLSKKFGRINEQTDIWGLGATMYHLLSGEVPFESREQIVDQDECTFQLKGISKLMEDLIKKSLERNRKYRYKNMKELMSDLVTIRDFYRKEESGVNDNTKHLFSQVNDKVELPLKMKKSDTDISYDLADTVTQMTIPQDREQDEKTSEKKPGINIEKNKAELVTNDDKDISNNIEKAISELRKLGHRIKGENGSADKQSFKNSKESEQKEVNFDKVFLKNEVIEPPQKSFHIINKVKLRSDYRSINRHEAQSIVKRKGFFDSKWNKKGEFPNRFELKNINGDHVVIDHITGLMWHQSGSIEHVSYKSAGQWLQALNKKKYSGYCDWRFPTLEEAASLLKNKTENDYIYMDPIFSKDQGWIYTGDKEGRISRWTVNFINGNVSRDFLESAYIRPLRSL